MAFFVKRRYRLKIIFYKVRISIKELQRKLKASKIFFIMNCTIFNKY
jgi:hypothetical protein